MHHGNDMDFNELTVELKGFFRIKKSKMAKH
jgi:hypothetical protein